MGVSALLLAVVVVRDAGVHAFVSEEPQRAIQLWPGHPDAEIGFAMAEIGRSAHDGTAIPATVFAHISEAARKAPLAAEPFLVLGVQAQTAANSKRAEQALLAAERRDPRSLPAHYFLAEHYFASDDVERGFAQVAMLVNLAPAGVASAAPYVAAYARDPSHWSKLRQMFRGNPAIEDAALVVLAADPANADLIIRLASPERRNAGSRWLPTLLDSLVTANEYSKARLVWASTSGASLASPLFDSGFSDAAPPPPFNWALTSSTVGLAERQAGGRLHIIYYGQEDGPLARQLLVLPPGHYRLSLRLLGDPSQAKALGWSVKCANAQSPIAVVPLDVAASRGMAFEITAACPAQWLELTGRSSDLPQQSDVVISSLKLDRGNG